MLESDCAFLGSILVVSQKLEDDKHALKELT
jgi:hypothetical protein